MYFKKKTFLIDFVIIVNFFVHSDKNKTFDIT